MLQAVCLILGGCFWLGISRRHTGIVGLLLISLPIMASLQFYAGYPLRQFATIVAEALLSIAQVDVVKEGAALRRGNTLVFVDPPCAGVNYLWMTGFIVFALASWRSYDWIRTISLGLVALMVALFGNAIRVALLFIKESGMVSLPDWTHAGIGAAVFAIVVWLLLRFSPQQVASVADSLHPHRSSRFPVSVILTVALLSITSHFIGAKPSSLFTNRTQTAANWPTKWDGQWLEPMPLTRKEKQFNQSFPGKIARFQAGNKEVIIKQVNRPTRKLHSITDCLRSAGWQIEAQDEAGLYKLSKQQKLRWVRERIYTKEVSAESPIWTDVSKWFWDCSQSKESGPWLAVIEVSSSNLNHQNQ